MWAGRAPICVWSAVCLVVFGLAGNGLHAQQPCTVTVSLKAPGAGSIFSIQQERVLGDIESAWIESKYQVVHDEELAVHLNTVAERVMAQFPGHQAPVRIMLIDVPEVDSFSAGPERVYISRKMIAMLKNEDELAGLLGHELAHVAMHQNAVTVSELFHEILGINTVSERKDIANKLTRLLDVIDRDEKLLRKAARVIGKQEAMHQREADRVAVYASAAAGFSPQAYVELFARATKTGGTTGNLLGDFLGAATSNERRLSEANKSLRQLPRPCRAVVPGETTEFDSWQAAVLAYQGPDRRSLTPAGEQ